MKVSRYTFAAAVALLSSAALVAAGLRESQGQPPPAGQTQPGAQATQTPAADDPVAIAVSRLTLESYKATLKGLTQFGDRRQGTKRNRDAVDWIEAQLKSYGCTNTERVTYQYPANAANAGERGAGAGGGGGQRGGGPGAGAGTGAGTGTGAAAGTAAAGTGQRQGAAGAGQQTTTQAGQAVGTPPAGQQQAGGRGGGGGRGGNQGVGRPTPTGGEVGRGGTTASSGATIFGWSTSYGVNRDLSRQPDERIRALNPEEPVNGERQFVYCTKVGTTRPDEMYILGAHMDGHGFNEAVNDDGSGTALVMELARVFHSAGMSDRALNPVRALEQRRDGPQRRPRLRRAAAIAAGHRESGRVTASIRSRSGSA